MSRDFHVGMSVRGALRNCTWRRELVGNCTVEGRVLTADEIFDMLCDELTKGHEIIPYSPCDNWDWKDGCQGHESGE